MIARLLALAPLLVPQLAPAPAIGEADRRPLPRWSATLRLADTTVDRGDPVTISGTVASAPRGTLVLVQKKQHGSGTWRTDVRLRTRAGGAWSYRDRPTTAGVRYYRAVVPSTAGHRQGTSSTKAMAVYRPHPLSDLPVIEQVATDYGPVTISGTTYDDAVVATPGATSGVVWWNTRGCLTLQYAMGNGDASGVGARARTDILLDGYYYFREVHEAGDRAATTEFPLRSTMRFAWNSEQTGEDATPAQAALVGVAWCAF